MSDPSVPQAALSPALTPEEWSTGLVYLDDWKGTSAAMSARGLMICDDDYYTGFTKYVERRPANRRLVSLRHHERIHAGRCRNAQVRRRERDADDG